MSINQLPLFVWICKKYDEVSIENTFKILIRIKMMFSCMALLKVVLEDITWHEILLKDVI